MRKFKGTQSSGGATAWTDVAKTLLLNGYRQHFVPWPLPLILTNPDEASECRISLTLDFPNGTEAVILLIARIKNSNP